MANQTQQPYWAFLYNDFSLETDTVKLRARVASLEGAIVDRLRELDGSDDSQVEKVAIQEACRQLLQVKVEKLGFPRGNDEPA